MKLKPLQLIDKISFYIFNIILLNFLFKIYQQESLNELFILGTTLLAIVGALSGLCYAGAQNIKNKDDTKVFRISGHRFLHSFICIIFSFIFSGAIIYIKSNDLFSIKYGFINTIAIIILIPFCIFYLLWAGRSFLMGFHMLRHILNFKFPLKDETLFDDIENEKETKSKK